MKKITRFIFGALSSFLLAIGLARAADKIDPITTQAASETVLSGTPDSTSYCDVVDSDN